MAKGKWFKTAVLENDMEGKKGKAFFFQCKMSCLSK